MRAICNFIILFILVNFVSCDNSIEGRIKKEFYKYAEENVDDPDAVDEIASIKYFNTIDFERYFSMCDSLLNKDISSIDSTYDNQFLLIGKLVIELQKAGASFDALKVADLVAKGQEYSEYRLNTFEEFDILEDSSKVFVEMGKTNDLNVAVYNINVRFNEEGRKYIKKYVALMKNNKITIYDEQGGEHSEELSIIKKKMKLMARYRELKTAYAKRELELIKHQKEILKYLTSIKKKYEK